MISGNSDYQYKHTHFYRHIVIGDKVILGFFNLPQAASIANKLYMQAWIFGALKL